jgi:hypothetical protein
MFPNDDEPVRFGPYAHAHACLTASLRWRKHGLHLGKRDVLCAMMPATRDSRSAGDARPSTPGFLPRISGERRHSRGLAMSFAATSASCARKDWKLRRGDSGRTTPNPGRTSDRPPSSAIR